MPSPGETATQHRRRRWRWLGLVVVVVLLVALHRPLLRSVAAVLVVDEPAEAASTVALQPFDRDDSAIFAAATGWARENSATRVLIIEPQPTRSVQYGVLPSFEAQAREQLSALGIADDSIQLVRGTAADAWDAARQLEPWLAEHAEAQVVLPVGHFQGRYWRQVLDASLPPEHAQRVLVSALEPESFDEHDWWTTRLGVQTIFGEWFYWIFAAVNGPRQTPSIRWDLEAYEAALARGRETQ